MSMVVRLQPALERQLRRVARRRRTTVSAVVSEYVQEGVAKEAPPPTPPAEEALRQFDAMVAEFKRSTPEAAEGSPAERLAESFAKFSVAVGPRDWKRDDLYE